jgi:LPXTG-site transpeptidase (sortase) family protein
MSFPNWRRLALACALCASVVTTAGCESPVTVSISSQQQAAAAPVVVVSPTARAFGDGAPTASARADTSSASSAVSGGLVTILRTPPATELEIPSIDLDTPIEESASAIEDDRWTWLLPEETAAHHLGTANPGEPGNIVISGHVSWAGTPAVFDRLPSVQVGDTIYVRSDGGTYQYTVVSTTTVPESDNSPIYQSPSEQLTLITCYPDGAFNHRVIVRATPVA